MSSTLIQNATVVLPDSIAEGTHLLVRDGAIESIGCDYDVPSDHRLDACGAFLLPGIIDLHTDALESEITPRPGANFPLDVAFQEIDTKMVACGITTVYHSLHLGYDAATKSSKSKYQRAEVIEKAWQFGKDFARANSKIHLRFEVSGIHSLETLETLIESGFIDLLSFMDHTPGQGQYPDHLFIKTRREEGHTEAEAMRELEKRKARPKASAAQIAALARKAQERGIPVASHDDDLPKKVRENHALGFSISEFPINLETARQATDLGMHVLGGASNILRGGSLTGNLCMADAVRAGVLSGLCSDYYPPSILHSAFKLNQGGDLSLPEAIRMATLNPAKAAGIDHATGSIEVGKAADIIIVETRELRPRVTHSLVQGHCVYASPNPRSAASPSSAPCFPQANERRYSNA